MQSQGPIRVRLVRVERVHRAFVRRLAEMAFAPWGPGYGERISDLGYAEQVCTLVGLVDDAPVGFVQVGQQEDAGEVFAVAVDPHWRRRGVGRALLDAGLAHLEATGAQRVGLHVADDNAPARRLFAQAGFSRQITNPEIRYPGGAQALRLCRPQAGASRVTREEFA